MTAGLQVEPGSDEWLQLITASKVAAILGLSPWESPFSLWHRMNGTVPGQGTSPAKERGHYLEPAIAQWFADQHPEWNVVYAPGLYLAAGNERHAASPDGLLHASSAGKASAALEVKTAARDDEWGRAGTDEVPIYYRAQALWQAYVLDVPRVHFAVLTSYLEFREYVVERDEEDLALIHQAVEAFLTSLDEGRPPLVDGSTATYEVVRRLHPEIDRELDVDVDPDLFAAWVEARRAAEEASDNQRHTAALLMEQMGSARRGLIDGVAVVRRQAKTGGSPYLTQIPTRQPQGGAA